MDVSYLDEAGVSPTLPINYGWSAVGERVTIPYEAPQGRRVNAVGAYFSDGPSAGRFVFETRASRPKQKKRKEKKSKEKPRPKGSRTASVQPSTDQSEAVSEIHDGSRGVDAPPDCGNLPEEQIGPIDAQVLTEFIWNQVVGRPEGVGPDWKRPIPLIIALDNYSVHHSARFHEEEPAWAKANVRLFYLPAYSPELSEIEPIWNDVKHHELQQRSYQEVAELKNAVDQALMREAEHLSQKKSKSNNLLCRSA